VQTNCSRESLGCWIDAASSGRAIAGGIRLRSVIIDDCQNFATDKGFSVFAIQYDNECFTAEDAEDTYDIHGPSNKCNTNGRGGEWVQNVYKISCQSGWYKSKR
jgi:hypothetical protein